MIYNSFKTKTIIKILILSGSFFLFFYVLNYSELKIFPIIIVIAIIYQIYQLIYHVEKTNRDLKIFFESIRHSDFSHSYKNHGLGKSFDELANAFNGVIKDFQKIRSEKEEHYYYIQNIIQHIDIAILSFQKDGKIEMINKAAKNLFEINFLKNINDLNDWNEEFVRVLSNIKTGENTLIKINKKDDIFQLSIYATEFRLNDRNVKLVSVKDIQAELEEKEMEAWQKLIRVLTHEIMNSIAPISSLTSTLMLMTKELNEELKTYLPDDFDDETAQDIKQALITIYKRSTGLIHFVDTYRNLTKIPKPNFSIFMVKDLFNHVCNLLQKDLEKQNITCEIDIQTSDLKIIADEQLIEQVMINLLKNAIHALEEKEGGKILLKSFVNKRGKTNIQIIDNGVGIVKEVLDRIFIPFFTTKTTGSGIGLSLSKQIMRLHKGNIIASSQENEYTKFTLIFP